MRCHRQRVRVPIMLRSSRRPLPPRRGRWLRLRNRHRPMPGDQPDSRIRRAIRFGQAGDRGGKDRCSETILKVSGHKRSCAAAGSLDVTVFRGCLSCHHGPIVIVHQPVVVPLVRQRRLGRARQRRSRPEATRLDHAGAGNGPCRQPPARVSFLSCRTRFASP